MDITQKARELGVSVQNLHKLVKTHPGIHGVQRVGNKWVFPDNVGEPGPDEVTEFPPEEESKRRKAHWDAQSAKQDYIKKLKVNQAASGHLVERESLESEYRKVLGAIRARVIALPAKLKRSVGEGLSELGEETLERMCNDLLREVIADAKQQTK